MNIGDLQVWWIPQMPGDEGEEFVVDIADVADGVKVMRILADYDRYQLDHKIKGDYCNMGGIHRWSDTGWEDWDDEESGEDDPEEYLRIQTETQTKVKPIRKGGQG